MGVVNANADAYVLLQYQLQPSGPAWPREGDNMGARIHPPTAAAMATWHARINEMVDEADARTTSELLTDWERVVGLPDPCLTAPTSTDERRRRVAARLVYQGGQSATFFIGLLGRLGYSASTVTTFAPMKCGSKCNAALNQGGWRNGWRVGVQAAANKKAMKVSGRCNDPLASWGDPGLACLLARYKPAHTVLLISYAV